MKEKLFDLIKSNLKNPRLYALLLALVVVFFLIFPYLDANVFYYKRINDRVDILAKVSDLDYDSIEKNAVLKAEYERILEEISSQPESMVSNILISETSERASIAKFITGGLLFWVISVCCFATKGFKNLGYRIFGFVLFIIIGTIFGFVAKSIPTVFNPLVNCIGFPIIQLIFVALLLTSSKKSSTKSNEK